MNRGFNYRRALKLLAPEKLAAYVTDKQPRPRPQKGRDMTNTTAEDWGLMKLGDGVPKSVAQIQAIDDEVQACNAAQSDELTPPTVFDVHDLSCGCVVRTDANHTDREGYTDWVRCCPYARRVLDDGTRLDKLNDHFAVTPSRVIARGRGEWGAA